MSKVGIAYRVIAYIVGINLIFVIGAWIAQMSTDEFSWWNRNSSLIGTIDMIHGYLFMALLVLIAVLARRLHWKPPFVITTMLLAGEGTAAASSRLIAVLARRLHWKPPFVITTMLLATVPFVSFWAEHRAANAIKRDEAAAVPSPAS